MEQSIRMLVNVSRSQTMFRLVVPMALAFALCGASCNEPAAPTTHHSGNSPSDACSVEPLMPFDASEMGVYAPTTSIAGTMQELAQPDEFGRTVMTVLDGSGARRRLALTLPEGSSVPVAPGSRVTIHLERVGGSPPAAALVIEDDAGLLFAGASDQAIGAHVLQGGITGFTFELLDQGCASRAHDSCIASVTNLALKATRGADSATLHHRDTATLGGFEVRCLVAQHATYTGQCPDMALQGVSFTIARVAR
jgi:hypothetical protein